MGKERLDKLVFECGYADSREKAQRLIMAGLVLVDGVLMDKPGSRVDTNAEIFVKETLKYVSRGGLKLEKAVDVFGINFLDKVVLDVGASTGGFTDLAIQNGARKVYAIDVGKGQLHYKLRQNSRVINLEEVNFRYADFEVVGENCDIFVTDVSFISLKHIIPSSEKFCREGCELCMLIKPQFEAGPKDVGKHGIVKDLAVHERVILDVIDNAMKHCMAFKGIVRSPIKGAKGNVEYLVYFVYKIKSTYTYDEILEEVRRGVYE